MDWIGGGHYGFCWRNGADARGGLVAGGVVFLLCEISVGAG